MNFKNPKGTGFKIALQEHYTMADFLEQIDTPVDSLGVWRHNLESEDQESKTSWDLNSGYDGAVKLASEGWREGREKMIEMSSDIAPVHDSRIGVGYDVTGAAPDVPLYCSGEPAHMMIPAPIQKPTMTIVVGIDKSSGVDAEDSMRWGLGLLALVDRYERSGVSCEVVAGAVSSGRWEAEGQRAELYVTIKAAGERLDLDRLAFAMAHPAMLRRLKFRWIETHEELFEGWSGGYDKPCDVEADLVEADLILPSVNNYVTDAQTVESAVEKIEELAAQQVEQ